MNILNKGKPKHKHMNPRRQWRKLLTALAVAASMAVAPAAMADTGIDTASYQGCWDGAQAKSSGVNFAFIKLNQGTGYVNPYATCQVNAARANGIREGAYDFASPQTSSPEAEADKFVAGHAAWSAAPSQCSTGSLPLPADIGASRHGGLYAGSTASRPHGASTR